MTQSLKERKPFHLVLLVIVILQSIRTKKERKTTLIDTVKMKTGKTLKPQVSMLKIVFGTNQLLKHQLKIQTKSFLIYISS